MDDVELMERIGGGTGEGEFETAKMVRFLIESMGPLLSPTLLLCANVSSLFQIFVHFSGIWITDALLLLLT